MNEQTLKELGIELKKLKLKEDEALIIEYDIKKIKPDDLFEIANFLQNEINNKIIGIPNDKSIELFSYNKDRLNALKENINRRIDNLKLMIEEAENDKIK